MDQRPEPKLNSLPVELLQQICLYLPPLDLLSLAKVSRIFPQFTRDDSYWRTAINNILPHPITSPHPFKSYKQLYISRFPYWFILERRFFFADYEGTGKLIVSRFNRATAGIEAFNVVVPRLNVAGNALGNGGLEVWEGREHEGWVLRSYLPDLQLWYDDPVIVIDSETTAQARLLAWNSSHSRKGGGNPSDEEEGEAKLRSDLQDSDPNAAEIIPWRNNSVVMELKSQPGIRNVIRLAVRADKLDLPPAAPNSSSMGTESVPWPPTTIPLPLPSQRIVTKPPYTAASDLSSLSTYGFHLGRSVGFQHRPGPYAFGVNMEVDATYATLDEEVYTTVPNKPLQGIWVGDYAGHGSEFLLFMHRDQNEDDNEGNGQRSTVTPPQTDDKGDLYSQTPALHQTTTQHNNNNNITPPSSSTPSPSPSHQQSSPTHPPAATLTPPRLSPISISPSSPPLLTPSSLTPIPLPSTGSLHAIKLTGDANIPRGQVSFMIPDLSPVNGLIRMARESPFTGSPVFRGKGHIARDGFVAEKWVDVDVIMVSVNLVAVVWTEIGLVSYLRRVDVRELWER